MRRLLPLNLPNLITLLRFPLAAAFPLADGLDARLVIVVLAAASDWVDGRLARRTHRVTRSGELLDPIADKTFMIVALATLVHDGLLPLWTVPVLLARDIAVIAGAAALSLVRRGVRMPARRAGKITTWLQFGAIATIIVVPHSAPWVAPLVGVAGIVAAVDYARAARGRMQGERTIEGGRDG